MSKPHNTKEGFTSGYVMVNRRANSTHPLFKGDGYALAIFLHLAANMAHKRTTDSLGKTENKVPLDRTQVLTSYRTLVAGLGFSKWIIESRIKKLVEGVRDSKGIIKKEPCENMPGLTRNDGMVITILSGAKFGSEPDTSQDAKPDYSNNSSSKTKANGVTKEDCDRVAQAMADSAVVPSELDTPEVREAWGDFIVHRKQLDPKSRGMTERASKIILNKLLDAKVMPDEAVRTFNAAIESGWKGVFPKERTIKAVKRTGKSSYAPAGPESLVANDMKAVA